MASGKFIQLCFKRRDVLSGRLERTFVLWRASSWFARTKRRMTVGGGASALARAGGLHGGGAIAPAPDGGGGASGGTRPHGVHEQTATRTTCTRNAAYARMRSAGVFTRRRWRRVQETAGPMRMLPGA